MSYPTERQENAKEWRNVLYSDYSSNFLNKGEEHDSIQVPLYGQIYLSYLPPERGSGILDLGCGRGQWLRWLRGKGYTQLTGVDLCEEDLASLASTGIKTENSDVIQFLMLTNSTFDVIHAKDLIEHLDKNEAVALCQAAHRALNPNGILILSTFNAQAPLAAATRYGDFTHESGFTHSSITQLLKACGFSKVHAQGMHICPPSLKGRIRKALYLPVNLLCRLVLGLRHGFNNSGFSNCDPDLLAYAVKAPSPSLSPNLQEQTSPATL